MKRGYRSLAVLLLFLPVLLPRPARAGVDPPPGKVLFRIGKTDGDTRDLALGPGGIGKYRFPGYFVPGWSEPERDWPYVHPGPMDPFGKKPFSTFTIAFGISALPASGRCRLVIDLADTQDKYPPTLVVRVNGTPFRRKLEAGHGEPTISGFPGQGVRRTLTFPFPVTLLKKGANEITLTSVKGCWFLYDALRLEVPPGVESAPLTRTLVYDLYVPPALLRTPKGPSLFLTAQVRRLGPPAPCKVLLDGRLLATVSLRTGWNPLELPVPDPGKARVSRLSLVVAGREAASRNVEIRPAPEWTIYLVPHSHVDIGYTDRQDVVEKKHWRYLQEAMDLAAKTASYPPGAEFKWDCESSWGVDSYFGMAGPAERKRFLSALRRGEIEIGALFANELTGICSREELFRMTRWAREFRRKYGLRLDTALITDVPGWTWGIVPALARSGVKYLSCGPNRMARIGYTLSRWGDRPFWWISPSGRERILCWVAGQGYSWFHHDGSLRTDKTFHYLEKLRSRGYPYDMIQVRYTTGGDNGPPNPTLPDQVRKWNEKYAYPRYVLATAGETMRAFEKKYGKRIPSFRGDFTPYWEDGAASTARETALNRETREILVSGEALWAMLRPASYPAKAYWSAWRYALLFDEHTWGAWCSVSKPDSPFTKEQWTRKKLYGSRAHFLARSLELQALRSGGPPRPTRRFEVLNPTSFPRKDPVFLEPAVAGDFSGVRDEKGRPRPAQRLKGGGLVFLPGPVPPFGSRVFSLVKDPTPWKGKPASAEGSVMKNGILSLRVDPDTGALGSVRWGDRELVDRTKGPGWNDYIYVPGRNPARAVRPGRPDIRVLEKGPLLASLEITSPAPGCNTLVRRVRLFAGLPFVEIRDILDKKKVRSPEGVHLAFPLAVPGGIPRIGIPWAVVRPGKDQLEGACRNFFCVERWLDVSNGDFGVTWVTRDAPLVEIGGITAERRPWLKRIRRSSLFYSYVMNNYWDTNYKADQEGKALFRYLLHPHGPFDPARSERTALAYCRPLVVRPVEEEGSGPLPSLLQVEPSWVVVSDLRPAADGKGLFLRLFNAGDRPARVRLRWGRKAPPRVYLSDADEEPLSPWPKESILPPMGILALRAIPEGK